MQLNCFKLLTWLIPKFLNLLLLQYVSSFVKTNRLIFDRYALIFSTAIVWIYALILTSSGVYNHKPLTTQLNCRTDYAGLIQEAAWSDLKLFLPKFVNLEKNSYWTRFFSLCAFVGCTYQDRFNGESPPLT